MTGQGQTSTEILDARGPTHTGSGDQHNYDIRMTLINQARYRRVRSGLWSRVQLDWIELRFVEPYGFDDASQTLDERNAVILNGPRGSGRRTAAMMLLNKATDRRGRGRRFRELFPAMADRDREDVAWDAADAVEPDERLLLDLSSLSEEEHALVDKGLMEFRGVIEDRKAFLAIIANSEYTLTEGIGSIGCRIRPPAAVDVLARHLEADDGFTESVGALEADSAWLGNLASMPMSEVARLAELTLAARGNSPFAGEAAWLESAFQALTDDGTAIAKRVSALQEAPQRALLLAAALLSGMTADVAADGAADLLKMLEYPETSPAVLDSPDLVERLDQVGARIDAERKVRFNQLAQDTAALVYYWDAFPDLRSHLAEWVSGVVRHEALTPEERDELVRRFATQSLRTDRSQDLETLITAWTENGGASQKSKLLQHAATLLDAGLTSKSHGSYYRRWIYDRSTQESPIRPDFATVLIEACMGQIAETHPDQALVRLHHLARRKGEVGELGRDALAAFVAEDERRLRRLLSRIAAPNGTPNPADATVFVRVADARRLTAQTHRSRPPISNARVAEHLAAGWHLVLNLRPSQEARARLGDWFQAAALGQERARFLGVLANAATDFRTASRLEAAVCAWATATLDEELSEGLGRAHRMAVAGQLIGELDRRHRVDTSPFPADHKPHRPSTPPTWEALQ
jgi:hypothetical protein